MTVEQRLSDLEKEVAELKDKVKQRGGEEMTIKRIVAQQIEAAEQPKGQLTIRFGGTVVDITQDSLVLTAPLITVQM